MAGAATFYPVGPAPTEQDIFGWAYAVNLFAAAVWS